MDRMRCNGTVCIQRTPNKSLTMDSVGEEAKSELHKKEYDREELKWEERDKWKEKTGV